MQNNTTKKGHLCKWEREIIEHLRKNGKGESYREIGEVLERDHSVICREIIRNGEDKGWGIIHYTAKLAEEKRIARRKKANRKHIKLLQNPAMYLLFKKLFEAYHDHRGIDEIVGYIRNKGEEMVCTSTIYNFIHLHKREREYWLRHGKHGYKKRKGAKKKTALVGVPLIEDRSEEINNRETFGNWEVDMVVGPKGEKGGLLTIVERLTRFTIIVKLEGATKEAVKDAITRELSSYKVESITSDNGSEFAAMAEVGKTLGCEVYRCHPYASREKGGNERNNGIIRRFCPKGLSIQQYSEEYIKEVERKINNKPRKILDYRNAGIVFTYYSSKET